MRGAFSFSSSLMLVIMASVVSMRPAIDGGVLQGRPRDLGRVDDAGLEHVDELAGVGVEADRRPRAT